MKYSLTETIKDLSDSYSSKLWNRYRKRTPADETEKETFVLFDKYMDGYNIRHFNMSLKSNGAAYSVNFSGFKVTENGRIATSVKSDIPLAGANAFFELNYKSVKWDNGVSDSVTVPSGARRYAFSDIMKLISQQ